MNTSAFTNISKTKVVLLHCILWICFLFFPLLIYKIDFFNIHFFKRDLVNNAFLIALFYINFYYLIPRFFGGKKLPLYFAIVVGCVIIFTLQQLAVEYFFMRIGDHGRPQFIPGFGLKERSAGDTFHRNFNLDTTHFGNSGGMRPPGGGMHGGGGPFEQQNFFSMPAFFWVEGLRRALSSVLTILFTGGFIRIALQWFKSEQQKEELEIQRLNVELDFLKAQINPHFLFNSLNTVYALAHKQSTQTEVVILKLSEILRYVLYEASAKKVLLIKELAYIDNYIDLQKYRIDKNMRIQYQLTGIADIQMIEPMILMTFVENAFKHGISYKPGSFINININVEDLLLTMQVSNTYNEVPAIEPYKGIGLMNVQKRLGLSYALQHTLKINTENGIYSVRLTLKLSK